MSNPSQPSSERIVLEHGHFAALVRGGEVTTASGTRLVLATDLGFRAMRDAIASADAGIDVRKPYTEPRAYAPPASRSVEFNLHDPREDGSCAGCGLAREHQGGVCASPSPGAIRSLRRAALYLKRRMESDHG